MSAPVSQDLAKPRQIWSLDPNIPLRIDDDVRAFVRYVEKRREHLELERKSFKGRYLANAVQLADGERTKAHETALRAAEDLNKLCVVVGLAPLAPACPEGEDLYSYDHRNAVARFIADVLDRDAAEHAALKL